MTHRDDSGLLAARELFELGERKRDLNERLESDLCVLVELARVLGVLLNIQPDGRSTRTGSRETEDNAGAVLEADIETLLLGDGTVDRVGVGKVVSLGDLEGGV